MTTSTTDAEARVRELEAMVSALNGDVHELGSRLSTIEAETIERCAKVAETEGAYPELNVWAGGPEWYRRGLRIAAAIRQLTQEVKHEAD